MHSDFEPPRASDDQPNDANRVAPRAEFLLGAAIAGVIAWLAIAGWFNPFRFTAFAGDDLRLFDVARQGVGVLIDGMATVYKFRPVTAVIDYAVAVSTKCDFRSVAAISIGIHALNALLFFWLVFRVLRLPVFLALGLTTVGVLNRFVTYIYMHEQALMEGMAVATLLVLVACALRFIDQPTLRRSVSLALLFLVIIHIHERYLVLAAPLMLLACFARAKRTPAAVLALGVLLSAAANIAVKKLWLATPVLIGATTQKIEFNLPQISAFVWSGVLNMVGINRGPAYLSVEDFPDSAGWVQAVSVGTAVVSCALLCWAVIAARGNTAAMRKICFFATAIPVLLLAASITFRQEYRWLYPAYLVFLLLVAFGVRGTARGLAWPHVTLAALIALSFAREVYLAQRYSRFAGFEAYEVANNLRQTLEHVDGVGGKDAIVVRGGVDASGWIFMGNTFSRVYGLPPLEFSGQTAGQEYSDGESEQLLVHYNPGARKFTVVPSKPDPGGEPDRMDFAVLEAVAATFPPNERLATPTKTPLFRMPTDGSEAMVAVSPAELSVPVPRPGAELRLSVSHVYALGDGVDVEVTAGSAAGAKRLLSRTVPPRLRSDAAAWRRFVLPLPPDASEVRVRIFSGSGDATADWIALRDFSFR